MKYLLYSFILIFACNVNARAADTLGLYLDKYFEYNFQEFKKMVHKNDLNKAYGMPGENQYVYVFSDDMSRDYISVGLDSDFNPSIPQDILIALDSINSRLLEFNLPVQGGSVNNPNGVEIYSFLLLGSKLNWSTTINLQKCKDSEILVDQIGTLISINEQNQNTANANYLTRVLESVKTKSDDFYQRCLELLNNRKFLNKTFLPVTNDPSQIIVIGVEMMQGVINDALSQKKDIKRIIWQSVILGNTTYLNSIRPNVNANLASTRINYNKYRDRILNVLDWYTSETLRTLKGGGNGGVIMPDFVLDISWTQVYDQNLFEQKYHKMAERYAGHIEEKFIERKNRSYYPYNDQDESLVDHIIKLSPQVPYGNYTSFDDQLAYLYERNNIFFIVVSDTASIYMDPIQWNGFANLVLDKLDRSIFGQTKIVLCTYPVLISPIGESNMMPGIAFDPNTVDFEELKNHLSEITSATELGKAGFKYCRKVVDIYSGFQYANGYRDVKRKTLQYDEGIGNPFNVNLGLFSSKYLEQIEALVKPNPEIFAPQGEGTMMVPNPNYDQELLRYELQKEQIIFEASLTLDQASSWGLISPSKKIVEGYLPHVIMNYIQEIAFASSFTQWCSNYNMIIDSDHEPFDAQVSALQQKHTYGSEYFTLIDPVVYGIIDIAGLVPVIGDFADCAGLCYASVTGNTENIENYALGLAVVGAGAVVVKMAKGGKAAYVAYKGKMFRSMAGGSLAELTSKSQYLKKKLCEYVLAHPDDMEGLSIKFINAAHDSKVSSHQIAYIRESPNREVKNQLIYLIGEEGTDIFQVLRNGDYPRLISITDELLDAQKRLSLSDILKNMSPETLGKLELDLAGEGGDALKVYFKENVGGVKAWERFFAGNSDDAIRKSTEWLERLSDDLSHPTWGEEIAQFLDENPADVKDVWKKLKDDPAYHWEVYDSEGFEIGSRWDKWSKREFFKSVTKKGKDFELDLLNKMKTRSGVAYNTLKNKVADLDDRYLISQMQFCRPGLSPPCNKKGEYFIADQVWIKYDEEGEIVDMVIVDSKLSYGTSFTPGQTAAKNNVGGNLSFKPSLSIETDINDQLLPSSISQGLEINTNSFYKAYGDGDKTFINIE